MPTAMREPSGETRGRRYSRGGKGSGSIWPSREIQASWNSVARGFRSMYASVPFPARSK